MRRCVGRSIVAVAVLFLCAAVLPGATGLLINLPSTSFTSGPAAPESLVSGFGENLAASAAAGDPGHLPTSLNGVSVTVTDSSGTSGVAPLYYVSAAQINYMIPAGLAPGLARVVVRNGDTVVSAGTTEIGAVAPSIFTANANGQGVAAANAVIAANGGAQQVKPVFACGAGSCAAVPVAPGSPGAPTILELYGTGIRGRADLAAVTATVGGTNAPVLYAGPQSQYPGLDQVNLELPPGLTPGQTVDIVITVAGLRANVTYILIGAVPQALVTALFDPAAPDTGPFPANLLTVPDPAQKTGIRVNLPLPDCQAQPSTCVELQMLNQLDGFNLQPRVHARFSGAVDTNTLRRGLLFLWLDNLTSEERGLQPVGHTTAINQVVFDPATNTVYGKPGEPFDQHRRYALIVTSAVKDTSGRTVSADPRFLSCVQQQATDYCMAVASAVAAARGAAGTEQVVSASVFTTLSATSWTEAARRVLDGVAPAFKPAAPQSLFDLTGLLRFTWRQQVKTNPPDFSEFTLPTPGLLLPDVGRLAFGSYQSPNFLNQQQLVLVVPTQSVVNAPPSAEIFFHALLPRSPMPGTGYPVVIFGHAFSESRFTSPTVVANTFAKAGFATVVINAVGHGFGPQGQLILTGLSGSTTLPAGGRGLDLNGDGTIGNREGCILFTPPLALRDCMRQTALDLAQLTRAIRAGIDVDGDGRPDLDGSKIYYAALSFGSMYGTVFSAIEPAVRVAALNVGGATVVDIARWGETFRDDAAGFLRSRTPSLLNAGGDFNDDYVLPDQPAHIVSVPGAIDIQNYFERLEWLQATGDPLSYAPHLRSSPLPGEGAKRVLWQFARLDRTVPNPANTNLIRAAAMADTAVLYRHDLARAAVPLLTDNPHAFLVDITNPAGIAIAGAAQSQIASFLSSDGAQISDANASLPSLVPHDLFQFPAPLPEDTGY
jgi:uncharacterized protein (TIGR03437 family)